MRPTYVSFLSPVVTVAWYTTSLTRHSPFSGHVFFFPTATRIPFVFLWLRCFCYLQDGFVVAIYYLLDVGHAAVAELYGVPVENFPQFVARWERSFNEADERTSDVGFDAFVIWWIKPYNISLSFAFL